MSYVAIIVTIGAINKKIFFDFNPDQNNIGKMIDRYTILVPKSGCFNIRNNVINGTAVKLMIINFKFDKYSGYLSIKYAV